MFDSKMKRNAPTKRVGVTRTSRLDLTPWIVPDGTESDASNVALRSAYRRASRNTPTTRPTIASNTITRIGPLDVGVADGEADATDGCVTGVAMLLSTSAAGLGNFDCSV